MGVSIHYVAHRGQPLTPHERAAVEELVARYSVENLIEEREQTGEGSNWESFCVFDPEEPTAPAVVFEGATKLPDNSEEAFWLGLQHWCRLLSEIRRALPRTTWQVYVDDYDIIWDEERGEYDPSQ